MSLQCTRCHHTQVKLANDDIVRIVHRKDRPDCSRFLCTHLVVMLGSVYYLSTFQYTPVHSSIFQYTPIHSSTLQYIPVYSSTLQYIPVYPSVHSSTLQYTPVHSSIPLSTLQYIIVYHLAVDVAYRYQELQLPREDSTLELTEKDDSTLELTQADDATPELTEDKVDLGNYSQPAG